MIPIEQIYSEHCAKIYGFFYWKSFSRTIAEDLTSQTFLILVEKSRESTPAREPVKFLYGIMRIVWLRYLQAKYKTHYKSFDDIDDFQAVVEETIQLEDNRSDEARIIEFIGKLPTSQQTIMRLRLIDRHSLSEICAQTGKDMNYVKTTQRRGIASLKKLVDEQALTKGVKNG